MDLKSWTTWQKEQICSIKAQKNERRHSISPKSTPIFPDWCLIEAYCNRCSTQNAPIPRRRAPLHCDHKLKYHKFSPSKDIKRFPHVPTWREGEEQARSGREGGRGGISLLVGGRLEAPLFGRVRPVAAIVMYGQMHQIAQDKQAMSFIRAIIALIWLPNESDPVAEIRVVRGPALMNFLPLVIKVACLRGDD